MDMNELLKDDHLAGFVLGEYLNNENMTDEEKLEFVCSSIEEFCIAVEFSKISSDKVSQH